MRRTVFGLGVSTLLPLPLIMIPCPHCHTEVQPRGFSIHLTRWCKARPAIIASALENRRVRIQDEVTARAEQGRVEDHAPSASQEEREDLSTQKFDSSSVITYYHLTNIFILNMIYLCSARLG